MKATVWGLDTFVGMMFLLAIFGLLISNASYIFNLVKTVGKDADDKTNWSFIMIGVIILFTVIAILLYSASIMRLSAAMEVGKREVAQCGNEYLEAETGNYKMLVEQLKEEMNYIIASFSFLSAALVLTMGYYVYYLTFKTDYKFKTGHPWWDTSWFINQLPLYGMIIATAIFVAGFSISFNNIVKSFGKSYLQNMPNIGGVSGASLGASAYAWTLPAFFAFWGIAVSIAMFDNSSELEFHKSMLWILIALSLVIIIVFAIQYQITRLMEVKNTYLSAANYLNAYTSHLATGAATGTTYETVSAKAKTTKDEFCKYLMRNIKRAHPGYEDDLDPGDKDLWPYLMHETNGKELNSLLKAFEKDCKTNPTNKTKATVITKFTCGNSVGSALQLPYKQSLGDPPVIPATIQIGIREILRDLRKFKGGEETISSLSAQAQGTLATTIVLLLYPVYHEYYLSDPDSTSIGAAIAIVSLFGLGGFCGWIAQMA